MGKAKRLAKTNETILETTDRRERTTPPLPVSSSVVVAQKNVQARSGSQGNDQASPGSLGSRKQTTTSEKEEKKKTKKTKQKVDIKFRCRKPDWHS
jgi:hypothetical protein